MIKKDDFYLKFESISQTRHYSIMKKFLFFLFFFIVFNSSSLMASDADFYRSTGKIYGVYGVVLILVVGLIIYLFSIDRKLSKIERNLDNE